MASTLRNPEALRKPTREEVELQLAHILQSRELQLPQRATSLLKFVVEEAIAGRAEYLKAFTIAMAVFNRNASFDPQIDPCVRIVAAHVRRALERYYLMDGIEDTVEITIPKGGYRPVFTLRSRPDAPETEVLAESEKELLLGWRERALQSIRCTDTRARNVSLLVGAAISAVVMLGILMQVGTSSLGPKASGGKPAVVVGSFTGDVGASMDAPAAAIVVDFRDQIIAHLVSRSELAVLIAQPDRPDDRRPLYLLDGDIRQDGGVYRMSARLIRESDGAVVWAESVDYGSTNIRNEAEGSARSFAFNAADRLSKLAALDSPAR